MSTAKAILPKTCLLWVVEKDTGKPSDFITSRIGSVEGCTIVSSIGSTLTALFGAEYGVAKLSEERLFREDCEEIVGCMDLGTELVGSFFRFSFFVPSCKTIKESSLTSTSPANGKCSATNRILGPKDHASIQINVGQIDETGRFTGSSTPLALCGFVRLKGESDYHLTRLAKDL
ncbi:hypothetical protein P9112_002956 [Eukaryota sp. TZLM1-RC]